MARWQLIRVHNEDSDECVYEAPALEDIAEYAALKGGFGARADGGGDDGSS